MRGNVGIRFLATPCHSPPPETPAWLANTEPFAAAIGYMAHRYRDFVEHPRYGQGPRITGLNPEDDGGGQVFLHPHSPEGVRIPNTAIAADLSLQRPATIPVTHYFDSTRRCIDCGRPFIFFAAEQKYWYEELGFPLDSDCVRCLTCRKRGQAIQLLRQRYERLLQATDRTFEQDLEMAGCCLSLVEAGAFHERQLQSVRRILSQVPRSSKTQSLWQRLRALESGG